jgi:hypothetical protein
MLFRRSNTPRTASYKHRPFWLQEIAGDAPDAPALQGAIKTDVAIAGGGYVGLWTLQDETLALSWPVGGRQCQKARSPHTSPV